MKKTILLFILSFLAVGYSFAQKVIKIPKNTDRQKVTTFDINESAKTLSIQIENDVLKTVDFTSLLSSLGSTTDASDLTSGILPDARLSTAVTNSLSLANSSLQGLTAGNNIIIDKTNPTNYVITATGGGGSGSSNWGELGGTLSNQTDLQAELDDKANINAGSPKQWIGFASGTQAEIDANISAITNATPANGTTLVFSTDAAAGTDGFVTSASFTDVDADTKRLTLTMNGVMSDLTADFDLPTGGGSITLDAQPTNNSPNAATSGGIYDMIQAIDLSVASKIYVDENNVASYANGIVIPEGVTSIENDGFKSLSVTTLSLPSTLTTIGDTSFNDNKITQLIIPNGTTTLGASSFQSNKIQSLIIPTSVTVIGSSAFRHNNISSLTLGTGLTTIADYSFYQNELTSLVIPDNILSIERSAFSYNNINTLTIGTGLTTIGISAFQDNSLTSLSIPNNVQYLSSNCFRDNNISTLTIGSGVTDIGSFAFSGNNLTTVIIPSNVTNLDTGVFANNNLTSFTWDCNISEIPHSFFSYNNFTNITIPNVVTVVGSAAFLDCSNLTTLTVHSGVTEIKSQAFKGTAITAVSLPTGITLGTDAFPSGTTITYY